MDAQIDLGVDPARNALTIQLTRPPDTDTGAHEFALHAELAVDGQVVFVPGVGTIADRATVSGGALVVYDDPHPIAIASVDGPVTVDAIAEESAPPGEPMRMSRRRRPIRPTGTDSPSCTSWPPSRPWSSGESWPSFRVSRPLQCTVA